jgi:hypothetical protein
MGIGRELIGRRRARCDGERNFGRDQSLLRPAFETDGGGRYPKEGNMRGNGSSCSRAKRTEVPVAVPRTQVRAKVELSRKEHQPQQKGGDSDFVAGAKHVYSHCRPKISPLVHQQNEAVPRRTRPFSPNQTSRFLRIPGYTSREPRQSASVKSLHAPTPTVRIYYFFATNVFASASSGRSAPLGHTSVSLA